ncbi:class I SAM-dependent methyltransferase [Tateyamaria omphalii]|uniref:class I SAM-dependent methyltransferase n=1 Tax=Tateyamaria omphalii TaxID=299262 RepID=UPI001C992A29|nr:class I SAM-dependent methyltransferase [Tateyamaria omphalii]MBY5932058.1 class I SAM-dependent methyltransferase [Tateyamaria omphalii]
MTEWDRAAQAWIEAQGTQGDFSRRRVLDPPMLARVYGFAPAHLLDLGCGEGRFCRLLAGKVGTLVGLDPSAALLTRASELGGARFVQGRAEALPFADGSFDMVVAYLSLLDIEGIEAALDEVVRVLRPGGRFLIANLTGFATASDIKSGGWRMLPDGGREIVVRRYLEPHPVPAEWRGIAVTNWHRPLSFYMRQLLQRGMVLTHFDEPAVPDPQDLKEEAYNNAPYQVMMEWQAAG